MTASMVYSPEFLNVLKDLKIDPDQVTKEVAIDAAAAAGLLDPAAGDSSLAPALEKTIVDFEQLERLSGITERQAPSDPPFAVTVFPIGKLTVRSGQTLIVRGAAGMPVLLVADRMIQAQGGYVRSESPAIFNIQTMTRED
ncbi:MAG: hypothetical protein LBV45_00615 [Xanthomonadaceae bacterium]|jgi:hypothetical protein|nr:hypothetical protein [Xanthomonadaceae bacterium]